ncbi:hypothetical protein [Psychrobacter ciconiae]|uniref:hypothetical protein n=1 Tax=Psychrobacter ciconiae TaxID=1553449 RepID=UPI00191AF753|nr:hypothetical protein [Psychrobacter ciconiae]
MTNLKLKFNNNEVTQLPLFALVNEPDAEVLEAFRERQLVFDGLIASHSANDVLLVIAINDVIYRYRIGWSAPYSESVTQAKDIAVQIIEQSPMDSQAIQTLIQAVYTFWFDESFAENVSIDACEKILVIYQQYLAGKYP